MCNTTFNYKQHHIKLCAKSYPTINNIAFNYMQHHIQLYDISYSPIFIFVEVKVKRYSTHCIEQFPRARRSIQREKFLNVFCQLSESMRTLNREFDQCNKTVNFLKLYGISFSLHVILFSIPTCFIFMCFLVIILCFGYFAIKPMFCMNNLYISNCILIIAV